MRRSEILTNLHAIDFSLCNLNLLFPAIEAEEPNPDVADGSDWINDTIEAFIKSFIISDSFNRIAQFKEVVDWLIDNPEILDEDISRLLNNIEEILTIAIKNINMVKRVLNANQIIRLMGVVAPFGANCRFLRKYCRPMNNIPQLKEVSEETQSKKKGRPQENFEGCVKSKYKNDTKKIVDKIRTLSDGKKGKGVAEVIQAAINAGYIITPGYASFNRTFPNYIDRNSYYKYLGKGKRLTVSEEIASKILL